MLAISTSWKSSAAKTGEDIIRPILDAGLRAVELEYRVTEEIFKQMLPALKKEEPAVSSMHNFFPVPPILRREQASGDAFLLSSLDKEERERAVKYTLRTFGFAREAGASAVVLHLGFTDMDDEYSRLKQEHEEGKVSVSPEHIRELRDERRKVSRKHLDAALFSLDRLWRSAERLSLKMGIENRNTLREVPDAEEMEAILTRFEGGPIGYWHDVGHAAVQEFLYGIEHESLLVRFSGRMVGMHLHDAEGAKDHKAPGKGKVDFDMLKKYVTPSVLRVIEIHSGVRAEELKEGLRFLSEHGLVLGEEMR